MFDDAAPGSHARRLLELYEKLASLQAEIAHVTAMVDDRDDHHAVDPTAAPVRLSTWLRTELRVGAGQAKREVARARALRSLPETMAVFAGGLVTAAHVDAIVPLVGLADGALQAGDLALLDSALADVAVAGTPRDVALVLEQVRHAADPDAAARRAHERETTHHLDLALFGDGSLAINGTLTPAAAAVVMKAIDSLSAPENGELRTKGQRQADALVELSRRCLERGAAAPVRRVRPHVTVLVPLSTLLDEDGNPGAVIPGVGPLDAAAARALICDANVRRAVVDDTGDRLPGFLLGPSAVLDLGRAVRTATDEQFHALVVRDGHCAYPGCGRQPDWCEAHHLREWDADAGPTDLANLALVCTEHHRALHRRQLCLQRNANGTYQTRRRDADAHLTAA